MNGLPHAKKSLGQHWLEDVAALEGMCAAANVQHTDTVLEIGPGAGTLTTLLVKKARQVVAVEVDQKLAAELPLRVPDANLQVVTSDILTYDLTALPADYKLVANIPYYLTSHLIRIISETSNRPNVAALLVQKEVAERVSATPGTMSLLSVSAQFYWEVKLGQVVPAALFTPPPKVDSQILILEQRTSPLFADVHEREFFRLVKAGYSQRRKTLLNSLAAGLHLDKTTVQDLCLHTGVSPARRPQTLSLTEWHQLYQAFNHVS